MSTLFDDAEVDAINEFKGDYDFLSNFFQCTITYEGLTYLSSEAAYQAMKSNDMNVRETFTNVTAGASKKMGRTVVIRDDWEFVKVQIMREIIAVKFAEGTPLAQRLLDTGDSLLIEGNWWNDRFWGVCKGEGKNVLGILLMTQRDKLRG